MAREEGKKVKMKQSTASRVFDLCNTIPMVLFCITILLPFWDVFVRSFSRAQDISYMHINLFPKVWTLDAYKYCFQDNEIITAFFVSVLRTIIGTVIHILVCYGGLFPDEDGYALPQIYYGGAFDTDVLFCRYDTDVSEYEKTGAFE